MPRATAAIACLVAFTAAGCSSSGTPDATSSGTGGSGSSGGTVTVLQGQAPDSLDPQYGYSQQSFAADAVVYTGLLQYAAKNGADGAELIPGLATALPTISADGLTYELTLRKGLTYSDGSAVKASDLGASIGRAIRIGWGGSGFYTDTIVGAKDFADKKAESISGITADDASGAIKITLTKAYGAFAQILALPSSSLVPASTPQEVLSDKPPVGVGPYKFTSVIPNQSFTLERNASFADFKIDGIPTGYADKVVVQQQTNTDTEAQAVLNDQADLFDPGDIVPASQLAAVKAKAGDRYTTVPSAAIRYFFLNAKVAPFNDADVRKAVISATDRVATSRLSGGSISPGCRFLPPTIPGHSDDPCAGVDPKTSPSQATVDAAKAVIASKGLAGSEVTVWSRTRSPFQEICAYYTDLLNQLGFKATLKVVKDEVYYSTVQQQATGAQTGYGSWSQDFPHPVDFYYLLSTAAINPDNNNNLGNVSDPRIDGDLAKLGAVPVSGLADSEADWKSLDDYVADKGYINVFGYQDLPYFTSSRVDRDAMVFSPVYAALYSTIRVKG